MAHRLPRSQKRDERKRQLQGATPSRMFTTGASSRREKVDRVYRGFLRLITLKRVVDDHLERRGVEAITGVFVLRTIRYGDEQIHLGAKLNIVAGF